MNVLLEQLLNTCHALLRGHRITLIGVSLRPLLKIFKDFATFNLLLHEGYGVFGVHILLKYAEILWYLNDHAPGC